VRLRTSGVSSSSVETWAAQLPQPGTAFRSVRGGGRPTVAADPDVARAAKFFNEPDETFGSLAKALEIVKDDLGQGNQERGG
jgi:hypothetical protein